MRLLCYVTILHTSFSYDIALREFHVGNGPEFFAISEDAVVTDRAGLEEGRVLAWTDLVESLSWLLIVLATEVVVRLKHTVFGIGEDQILYLWDELVWVLGFRFIDRNIRDWRVWRSEAH